MEIKKEESKIEEKSYREFFYSYYFGWSLRKDEVKSEEKIREMTGIYMKEYQFYLLYFIKGLPSWTQSYGEFNTAPLLEDIINFIETSPHQQLSDLKNFELGEPLSNFQLLSSITTVEDKLISLPEQIQEMMVSNPDVFVKIQGCPGQYKTHRYGDEILILPPLPYNKILSLFSYIDPSKFTPNETLRNTFTKIISLTKFENNILKTELT